MPAVKPKRYHAPRIAAQPLPPRERLLGKPLSPREAEVARAVSTGKMNKEIAFDFQISEQQVRALVSLALAKTGTPNRTSLALWWISKHGARIELRGSPPGP